MISRAGVRAHTRTEISGEQVAHGGTGESVLRDHHTSSDNPRVRCSSCTRLCAHADASVLARSSPAYQTALPSLPPPGSTSPTPPPSQAAALRLECVWAGVCSVRVVLVLLISSIVGIQTRSQHVITRGNPSVLCHIMSRPCLPSVFLPHI